MPRRRYPLLGAAGALWWRLSGWRIDGQLPDLARVVVVVAPHSSNWDFVHAVAAVFALGLRVAFIGKHTLFRGPLGRFMSWLGGVPVDRSQPDGVAEAAARFLVDAPPTWLGLAPEGTRAPGAPFKSGFYRIALAAGVPIVPVCIDYRRRAIVLLAPHQPAADVARGVAAIRDEMLARGCRRDVAK